MKRTITLLIFLTINFFASSQIGSSSPYSFAGIGEINFRGNQINRFMGGIDIYNDSIHANLNNPASYGDLKMVTYSMGINYKVTNLSDKQSSYKSSNSSLDYLGIAIPAGKFGFGFGLVPYSSVGYRLEGRNDLLNSNSTNQFEGSGGINRAFFSLGFRFAKYFSIGATFNYGFGEITYRTTKLIDNIELVTILQNKSSLSGLSYQITSNLKLPVTEELDFHLMYSLSPESNTKSKNSRIYLTDSQSNINVGSDFEEVDLSTSGLSNTKVNLSKMSAIGVGLSKEKNWFFGAQYSMVNSESFRNDFITIPNLTYQNGSRISVGGFYIPNYSSITDYWKRIVFRLGYRNELSGIIVNNFVLRETGITFGFGLPMAGYSNTNIGFEIGKRGSIENNLVMEKFWSLRIGFSLNDIWFIKRQYN